MQRHVCEREYIIRYLELMLDTRRDEQEVKELRGMLMREGIPTPSITDVKEVVKTINNWRVDHFYSFDMLIGYFYTARFCPNCGECTYSLTKCGKCETKNVDMLRELRKISRQEEIKAVYINNMSTLVYVFTKTNKVLKAKKIAIDKWLFSCVGIIDGKEREIIYLKNEMLAEVINYGIATTDYLYTQYKLKGVIQEDFLEQPDFKSVQ